MAKQHIRLSASDRITRMVKMVFLTVMALLVIIPFLWMILTSLMLTPSPC